MGSRRDGNVGKWIEPIENRQRTKGSSSSEVGPGKRKLHLAVKKDQPRVELITTKEEVLRSKMD